MCKTETTKGDRKPQENAAAVKEASIAHELKALHPLEFSEPQSIKIHLTFEPNIMSSLQPPFTISNLK